MVFRRPRVLVAALVVVGLGVGACGGETISAASGARVDVEAIVDRAGTDDDGRPSLDPAPDDLIEPDAGSQSQRLIAEAAQTSTFCSVAHALANLAEPEWNDLEDLVEWANGYYTNTGKLDRRSEVVDPATGDRVRVPDELVDLVETLRAASYAHLVRLRYYEEVHRGDLIDDSELRRRLDHAFVVLVNSEFTEADKALVETSNRYCP